MKHSYSAMKTFATCPRQYEALYLLRNVPRKSSPALEKGIAWHEAMEKALEGAPLPAHLTWWQGLVDKLRAAGAVPERKVAVTRELKPTGFFDDDVWLRGAIDVQLHGGKRCLMIDWKTGKVYPDPLQAEVYALMQWAEHPAVTIGFAFAYLEHKRTVSVDVDKGSTARVVAFLERIEATEVFTPRPCFACRFCPVTSCEYNEA